MPPRRPPAGRRKTTTSAPLLGGPKTAAEVPLPLSLVQEIARSSMLRLPDVDIARGNRAGRSVPCRVRRPAGAGLGRRFSATATVHRDRARCRRRSERDAGGFAAASDRAVPCCAADAGRANGICVRCRASRGPQQDPVLLRMRKPRTSPQRRLLRWRPGCRRHGDGVGTSRPWLTGLPRRRA
jgi:hypothetical protein